MEGSSNQSEPRTGFSLFFRNWISLAGLVVLVGSAFAFLVLFFLELSTHHNPYVGLLAYMVAPAFAGLGGFLMVVGFFIERRHIRKTGEASPLIHIDTSRLRDRRVLVVFAVLGVAFLLLSALGSYGTYHYTESTSFCGQTCHVVMEPEFVTYQNSPHARVACTACHIGPGAEWYVKAKISGLYQVYSVLFNKFSRPVPTPIHNLRPAQDTCEQCHWPRKFIGNTDRTYQHYLADDKNTPFAVRLLLRVGGGDPTSGPVGGIHWHMNVNNKVEYVATDEKRQEIPWIRVTAPDGKVTIYKDPAWKDDPSRHELRRMDCMDCHNRPSHQYSTPNEAVDLALWLGNIDPAIPRVKVNAVAVLTGEYATRAEALEQIDRRMRELHPNDARIDKAIQAIQEIYARNFFPEMKASWKAYPSNIGHKEWKGCFRCHDNKHVADSDVRKVISMDCDACHVILAQGSGKQLSDLSARGHRFNHPTGETGTTRCDECHAGTVP